MLSPLVSLCLLLVAAVSLVDGQLTPKCDEAVISNIKDYYSKNGYPPSMAVGSKSWVVTQYSLPLIFICVKEEVEVDKVTSSLYFTWTNTKVYENIVTFTGDVKNGLIVQTVKRTGEVIHLYIIKSTKDINVFYVCDPTSKNTILGHQGGVALPVGKVVDEKTTKEVKAMKDLLSNMGIRTISYPSC